MQKIRSSIDRFVYWLFSLCFCSINYWLIYTLISKSYDDYKHTAMRLFILIKYENSFKFIDKKSKYIWPVKENFSNLSWHKYDKNVFWLLKSFSLLIRLNSMHQKEKYIVIISFSFHHAMNFVILPVFFNANFDSFILLKDFSSFRNFY